jgi:hypothetical protein
MKTRSITWTAALFVLMVFVLFPLVSTGQVSGAASLQVKENLIPSLGSGKVKVRFYTDYYCAPCRVLEPKIEPVIMDLLKRNAITITFIDAPFHKYSSLYVKYFLFIYRERKDPAYVLKARNLLFEASKERTKEGVETITEPVALENYLAKNGLRFQLYDVTPVFAALQGYLQEDRINLTPSCVIVNGDKKESFKGGADIIKALTAIK